MIEFRCVVTVNTPAVWLARENIKRLTPRPCINVEYSHRVVYIEEEWRSPESPSTHLINCPVSRSYIYQTPLVHDSPVTRTQSSIENLVPETSINGINSTDTINSINSTNSINSIDSIKIINSINGMCVPPFLHDDDLMT